MNFIRINEQTLAQGDAVFHDYARAAMCGPDDREGYSIGRRRRGGLAALPGATIACLDSGILDRHAVVCAVARATRCRQSTVDTFLETFLPLPIEIDAYEPEASCILEDQLLTSTVLLAA